MNKGGPARDIRANGPAGAGNGPAAGPAKKLDRKTKKGLLLRLGGYILQYWPLFLLAVLLTLASNQLSLMGPSYSGEAIDAIAAESGVNFEAVWTNVGPDAGLLRCIGRFILCACHFNDPAQPTYCLYNAKTAFRKTHLAASQLLRIHIPPATSSAASLTILIPSTHRFQTTWYR